MSTALLVLVFLVVHGLSAYLLATGGVLADFRRRPLSELARTDGSEVLADAPARWIENHEFWEMSATSSVGGEFWDDETADPAATSEPAPARSEPAVAVTARDLAAG